MTLVPSWFHSRRVLAGAVSLVVLAFGALHTAAGAEPALAPDEIDTLVKQGNELRRNGDDQHALPMLQKAYRLVPTPRTAVQLGLVEHALGRWADADLHLTTGLKATSDPWIKRNRTAIQETLEAVKIKVGRIEINGEPNGAEVLVGGRSVGRIPLTEAIRVNQGTVDIELRAPGYKTILRSITIAGGQYQPLVMRLEAQSGRGQLADAKEPTGRPDLVAGLAATSRDAEAAASGGINGRRWAVGGMLLGTAAGLGFGIFEAFHHATNVTAFNDHKCVETPSGAFRLSDGQHDDQCERLAATYNTARTLEFVGFAAAGVFAATALIVGLAGSDSHSEASDEGRKRARVASRLQCAMNLVNPGLVCGQTF
jgi:hypothetical protein